MGRAPCCDKANVKKGPWSPEEDAKLKSYMEHHGTGGNWIALPQKIGLKRCGKSCRLRWLNYLRPNIKHGSFSEEEDNLICSLYVSIGSRWSIIAAQLPGRTDNDIKNYWNTRLKKKLIGKQRNNKQHQQHAHAQARRVNTHQHHHHLVSSSSEGEAGILVNIPQTTPNVWPTTAQDHCVAAAPIMPVIIPNHNIIQQHYDQSSSSTSSQSITSINFLNELDGIEFPNDQQKQPYTINLHDTLDILSFPQDQVYPASAATTMTTVMSSDDANKFQGYENLFQCDDDLSHLASVNPQESVESGSSMTQLQGFYEIMESMRMAISGSTNTTSTDQSTSTWGDDTSSLAVINYPPNLVSDQHYEEGFRQGGIPRHQDAPFQDSNRYFGIHLQ